jgi:hypothetical protein
MNHVIKEKEYGMAYLTDFDKAKAAEDWWDTHFYNENTAKALKKRKKKYSKEAVMTYRIVDIFVNALRRTMFGEFLCNKDKVWEKYKTVEKSE